jgi:hypothetical protein
MMLAYDIAKMERVVRIRQAEKARRFSDIKKTSGWSSTLSGLLTRRGRV